MGVKFKKLLSFLVAFCMVVMSVANVQEVRLRADESANEPVTFEYFDEEGNPVTGTCYDYNVVTNVATGGAIGVASGGAIGVATGGAIGVASGGAISIASGSAITCASCGAIILASGSAISASGGAITVASGSAISASGSAITCASCGAITVVSDGAISASGSAISASGSAITWGEDGQQWYVVEGNITVGVRIKIASGASVNLILKDGCTLTASEGITVPLGSGLNIFGQGSGSSDPGRLSAYGNSYCAGIGGEYGQPVGDINIRGGIVTATAGYGAAGIGGGYESRGHGGNITISGGTVIATGGYGAAGIGAGMYGTAGEVTVAVGMKAFSSEYNNYGYSPLVSGSTGIGSYVVAYKEHSGIMSASGNTVTAEYIDVTGTKSSVSLSIVAPEPVLYGNSQTAAVTLANVDAFNTALGKTGDEAVSEAQVIYFDSLGEELVGVPTVSGSYTAKITVDGVTAQLEYELEINPPVNYEYFDISGNSQIGVCSDYVVVTCDTLQWDGYEHEWYVVYGDVYLSNRVEVSGAVNLILMDGCTLTAAQGINVSGGWILNIYGQGSDAGTQGRLYAHGGYGQAGIGGGYEQPGGIVYINGGFINAAGGDSAAGIGGGNYGHGGIATINGGTVVANGGIYGAGIGGGDWYANGGITVVNGGKVTATGGYTAAGIGGGWQGVGGSVVIAGGEVTATAGEYAGAGIGGGLAYETTGSISVYQGMKVFASADAYVNYTSVVTGTSNSGRYAIAYKEYSGIMSASGNSIVATYIDQNGSKNNAVLSIEVPDLLYGNPEADKATLPGVESFNYALGRTGQYEVSESQIRYYNSSGEAVQGVPTTAGRYKAQISVDGTTAEADFDLLYKYVNSNDTSWDGSTYSCYVVDGDVTVNSRIMVSGKVDLVLLDGCRLTAGNGINVSEGNELTILSKGASDGMPGELIATGILDTAGIGGGSYENSGKITINGGKVTATGGDYAAGIGGGYYSDGNNITINGGKVTAYGGGNSAGIGGGYLHNGRNITINGGRVAAYGGGNGSGIGGGVYGVGDNISIMGGSVIAAGGQVLLRGSGIGPGGEYYELPNGSLTIADTMHVYTSMDDVLYNQLPSGLTNKDRYVIAYEHNDGVVSADGNTITSTYIDINGIKSSVDLSIVAPPVLYGDNAVARATLDNAMVFNGVRYKGGDDGVSESQIMYYDENGTKLESDITKSGSYEARLTVNGETAVLDFDAVINPPVEYYYFDNSGNVIGGVCEDYHVVECCDTVWDGTSGLWCIVHDPTALNDRVTVLGTVNLILMDGCDLMACGGINVSAGNTLNIYGQRNNSLAPGRLSSSGFDNQAGIGGSEHESSGTIIINGGMIYASGGFSGAGIGGGSYGSGGTTIINDGIVDAVGGYYGAGIGGGDWYGTGGNITINGGRINVMAGNYAAGLGGGWAGVGENLYLNGGSVTVTTGQYGGTAIGGGSGYDISGTVIAGPGMKVFAYTDYSGYSDVTSLSAFEGRRVYAFKEHAGLLSGTGNVITSSYFDQYGNMQYATLALQAPSVRYDIPQSRYATLMYLDEFNQALGRSGSSAVSESQIKYYYRNGTELSGAPIEPGSYTAKITFEGVTAGVDYEIDYTLVRSDTPVWDGTGNPGKFFVVDENVTIQDRITVEGTVNLLLMDGCTLTANRGINVSEGNSITIMDQGTVDGVPGKLYAYTDTNFAAIGGGHCENAGNITINGGTIIARTLYWAAGIGGGIQGSGGIITINGGNVTASGGNSAAGIGGGERGFGGVITIYGGTVTATGGNRGAGIGSGYGYGYWDEQDSGIISIYGGMVTANGGTESGAGIGGGSFANAGNISIYGGEVIATGDGYGAGIGAGQSGSGGLITLWGGNTYATGGPNGYALGRGGNRDEAAPGILTVNPEMYAITWNDDGTGRALTSGITGSERYALAYKSPIFIHPNDYIVPLN